MTRGPEVRPPLAWVKRQYSGTLGNVWSCQIAVSLHAVSTKGTVPWGFRLNVPEDWCGDPARRREAKIPAELEAATKPTLAAGLVARAAGWKIRRAPVLGDLSAHRRARGRGGASNPPHFAVIRPTS
ncbi:MAG: transposase [Solirubrobacteraceae bacterium]